jgi:hypothetical protein
MIESSEMISVDLDSQRIDKIGRKNESEKIWLERKNSRWFLSEKPSAVLKGPHRYGTFKDAVNNRVVFVYGTQGSDEENAWALNKARYDAEIFWYQGNGAIEIIADSEFRAEAYPDRNVMIYGNAGTNSAWDILLAESPVQVTKNLVTLGGKQIPGMELGCVFIRPRSDSEYASIGVVSGSGIVGMRLNDNRPYLYPGYALPDCLVYAPEILKGESAGIRAAGFFAEDWSVENGEFIYNE